MEAELVALYLTCSEVKSLNNLLADIPFINKTICTIVIHCDNQATITKVKNII